MSIRARQLQCLGLIIGLAVGFQTHAASDQAVVRKPSRVPLEVGQAFVAHRGAHCIALLPTHVVADAGVPSLRYVGTGRKQLGDLTGTRELGDDLSLGTITGAITRDCGHSLASFSRAVDARLSRSTLGALRFVNGDGSLGFEPVVWLDDDRALFIRVKPASANGVLRKGMSGSLLMSRDNTPLGMLLSVSTRSGVGTVMRIDRMLERAESALSGDAGSVAESTPQEASQAREKSSITLAAWSADAQSADTRPANLLATDEDTGPWISTKIDKPVALDFNVTGGAIISGITLDAGSVAPDLLPSAAEVFVTSDPEFHRARSVWGGSVDFSEKPQTTLRFAPARAKAFRIVLYPKGSQVGLARVSVQP